MLVAAFRATLEEVIEADLIMHVRDISHQESDAQAHDVEEVLDQLGVTHQDGAQIIEIWNKMDRLDAEAQTRIRNLAARRAAEQRPVLVSALSGEGMDELPSSIQSRLAARRVTLDLDVPASDGAGLSWLHRHAEVLAQQPQDDGRLMLTIRTDASNAERARAKFPPSGALPSR
jgi:GTPase